MNDPNESQAGPDDEHVEGADTQATGKGQRGKTRAEERIEDLDTSSDAPRRAGRGCARHVRRPRRRSREHRAQWQRTAADFQNYRRRTEQERFRELRPRLRGPAAQGAGRRGRLRPGHRACAPGRAGAAWVEGVAAIDRKVAALLTAEGVTPIEALGHPFDPRRHEAIIHEPTTRSPTGWSRGSSSAATSSAIACCVRRWSSSPALDNHTQPPTTLTPGPAARRQD